ncbi:unnamed protein product [Adineta steineri]|uniref:NAD(P)(+)--arginine ADP-ribosyltransferase n=1 Tax=Adineta steineri TaxID=433720 RepID=A0A814PSR1_9BILA|nr:unnamed protein product [Adineta steineri]CAF1110032.1 unnamed protein product [Adineta steineri]
MKHRLRYALNSSNNNLKLFNMVNECMNYISSAIHENIYFIISGEFGEQIVPQIYQCPQIISIYIFCIDKEKHEKWSNNYNTKISGVFVDKSLLFKTLGHDVQLRIENSLAMSVFSIDDIKQNSVRDLNRDNATFLWFQLLIDTLIIIPCDSNAKNEMLDECRLQYQNDDKELAKINTFEAEYTAANALRWYTTDCFLYRLLNKAFRTEDIDIIFKFRFYIIDLYNNLSELYNEWRRQYVGPRKLTVYRGQRLSSDELNQIENSSGKLISINTFFSTTTDSAMAYAFSGADDSRSERGFESVMFQIEIDVEITTKPFANIKDFSSMKHEDETLFSMGTVFRVEDVTRFTTASLIVLSLSNEEDEELKKLIDHYRQQDNDEKTASQEHLGIPQQTKNENTLSLFGDLLKRTGDFERAEKYYRIRLGQLQNNDTHIPLIYMLIAGTHVQRGQFIQALDHQYIALDIITKQDPSNILFSAHACIQLSSTLLSLGRLDEAIEYRLKAIDFYAEIFIPQHSILAEQYIELARIYCYRGNYSIALNTLFKARDILRNDAKQLEPRKYFQWHSALHEGLGEVYYAMANHDKAILNYQIAAENLLKYVPENDTPLLEAYRNIGEIYRDKTDYDKALHYQEQALVIANKTLPRNHPMRAKYLIAVALTNECKGDLEKSLKYLEEAKDLINETRQTNHPILAWIYHNIGSIYKKKKKLQQALEYELKALYIRQISLSPNHKDIVCSYFALGELYLDINNDKEALRNFEKAADAFTEAGIAKNYQQIQTFVHMACIHFKYNNFTEAIQNYENALSHMFEPNVELEAKLWRAMGAVYSKKGNRYNAALVHFTIALNKREQHLSQNRLKIAEIYFQIGTLHQAFNKPHLALKNYETSLEIASKISPAPAAAILQITNAIERVSALVTEDNNND